MTLEPGGRLAAAFLEDHNLMVAVHSGSVRTTDDKSDVDVTAPTLAIFSLGDEVRLTAGREGAQLLNVAGQPISSRSNEGGRS